MNNIPLISVIIPVYNASTYLNACIECLLNQTFKNIEIIAVNDGSKDNSLDILKAYSSRISNLKVIDQLNSGASEARKRGLHSATGKYVVFLDADDWLDKDALYKMVYRCEELDLDFLEITFTYYFSEIQKYQSYHRNTGIFSGRELLNVVFDINDELAITSAMSKRSIWTDDVFLPADKRLPNEDIFPWFTMWKHIKRAEIRNDMPYYYYRYNPNSATNSGVLLKQQTLWKDYFIEVRKRLQECGIISEFEAKLHIIETDRLVFNVSHYDKSDDWYKQVLKYDTSEYDIKHKIAAMLLHCPAICKYLVNFNRSIKRIKLRFKNYLEYISHKKSNGSKSA